MSAAIGSSTTLCSGGLRAPATHRGPRVPASWLISLALASAAVTAVFAAASSLAVTSDTLFGTQVTVPHCDLSVTSTITSVGGLGIDVDAVELTNLDVACDGKTFKVALVRANGSMLGAEETGTFSLVGCGVTCTTSVSFSAQGLPFPDADHAALDIHG